MPNSLVSVTRRVLPPSDTWTVSRRVTRSASVPPVFGNAMGEADQVPIQRWAAEAFVRKVKQLVKSTPSKTR